MFPDIYFQSLFLKEQESLCREYGYQEYIHTTHAKVIVSPFVDVKNGKRVAGLYW